jgi:hypothetical protein
MKTTIDQLAAAMPLEVLPAPGGRVYLYRTAPDGSVDLSGPYYFVPLLPENALEPDAAAIWDGTGIRFVSRGAGHALRRSEQAP